MIKYVTYCTISDKLTKTDSLVIQINDRAGEDHTNIQLSYTKGNPISDFSAWIEDSLGNVIRVIKNKEISDINAVSGSFYSDEFTKKFKLTHNVYPYRVCYTYKSTYKQFLNAASWYPVISYDVPTENARLIVTHPESYQVAILQNLVMQPETYSESGIIRRVWKTGYDGNIKRETFCPDLTDFVPGVRIIPVNFTYGLPGSTESWLSFGNWQFYLINGLSELPESEQQVIMPLLNNVTDKREIVRILYHYLQDHTHYINVDIGIGGLKPYPASYVAVNKYGDCKALTMYMKALLKFAGIESFYVLVNAGRQPVQILLETPFQQFNHVILAVPMENDTIWLENTSNSQPCGYTGTFIQNRYGLLIDRNMSHLVRIPPITPEDALNSCVMHFVINNDGGATVTARYNLKGSSFEIYNELISNYSQDEQNKYIHDNLPFRSFELSEWKIIKESRDASSLVMVVTLKTDRLISNIGTESYFSYQPIQIPEFESVANRRLPVQIAYPVCLADTITYHLPQGKRTKSLPKDLSVESKYGSYRISFKEEENAVSIVRRFQLHQQWIANTEYADFYKFISDIKAIEKIKILYQ